MMERVKKAINFQNPDRIPLLFFNRDKEKSDIIMIDVVEHFDYEGTGKSEWGFQWNKIDDTMGQPDLPVIRTEDDLKRYTPPNPYTPNRFSHVKAEMEKYPDCYYLASLVLTGFTTTTFLRGFENTLTDLYDDEVLANAVADLVFGFEEEVIKQLKNQGFHGIAFFDDWGTQDSLIISPDKWRAFYKPRYQKLFTLAHSHGLDVYFHCCGNIIDIIPDLIESGVDMLNISQPNIFNIKKLGDDFRGKICFVCPISYQTTSISGTREEIFDEAKMLTENLGAENGGFIGYIEEYKSMGMSEDNYKACAEAFFR